MSGKQGGYVGQGVRIMERELSLSAACRAILSAIVPGTRDEGGSGAAAD